MANVNDTNINPTTVKIPSGYSNSPQVGRLQLLYDSNNEYLYTKLSPYTDNSGLLSFGPKQPYVYVNPNQGRKGINGLKRFETQGFPFASSLLDTGRIAKFLISGKGLIFTTKQFFLQKNQPFNETRIYNPLSPLLATSRRINPFSDSNPTRHIDTSGGALGSLASLVGISAFNKPTPPPGTVGLAALADANKSNSKGLLRAQTATSGYNSLINKNAKSKGLLGNLTSLAKSLFGGYGPQKQPVKDTFRADEGAYGLFLTQTDKFTYLDKDGKPIKFGEDYFIRFEAGKNGGNAKESIKKNGEKSTSDSNRTIKIFGQSVPKTSKYFGSQLGYELRTVGGYIKYGDNVGKVRIDAEGGNPTYEYSDILSIYKLYTDVAKPINTDNKFNVKSKQPYKDVTDSLKKVIAKFDASGYKYSANSGDLLMQQFSNNSFPGMDNITQQTKDPHAQTTPTNYNASYGRHTRNNRSHLERVKKMTNSGDYINTLTVLTGSNIDNNLILGKDFKPYENDQVAFYFHDLVNDRYIPFRATFKGLNEQLTSDWSDVKYIGRADKLCNYIGFTRTISFNFSVVAFSIKELLPMWTRINYLATMVKPAKYTESGVGTNSTSQFIVPPLLTVTIGDMYKEQPFILKSVGISIPEDSLWETLSETYAEQNDWAYLNDKLQWDDSKNKFAQFPRECDISISGDLLEQERPMVGKNNFGGVGPNAKTFSKSLIV